MRCWFFLAVFAPLFFQIPICAADLSTEGALQEQTFDAAWEIIRDSFFDPKLHGLDWEAVRKELRPKAAAAKSAADVRSVIQEMLERLEASHMALIPGDLAQTFREITGDASSGGTSSKGGVTPERSTSSESPRESSESGRRDGDLGFQFRYFDKQMLVTRVDESGPAAKAGILPGWILEAVGEVSVQFLLRDLPTSLAVHRQQFMAWTLVASKLMGSPGTQVTLAFRNGKDEPVKVRLERRHQVGEPTKLGYLPTLYSRFESQQRELEGGGTVGVLWFNMWMMPIVQALDRKIDEFRTADGMVLDLRGNVGGLGGMIMGVSGHFLNERISLGTLTMRGNELKFFANPRRVNAAGTRVEPYAGPLAILVDGLSLSAAEIFAGGMQALGRARVFGETTGGQALPAVWDRLPNGDVLYHAFGDFVTASGERLEGRGVLPDVVVAADRTDLLAGRDVVLERALKWISEERSKRKTNPDK